MSELTRTQVVILLVSNSLLVAGTVGLTRWRLRTVAALPARRDLVVVGCAVAGMLLLLAELLLPWASASDGQRDDFTRAAGSSALGASATVGSMAVLGLIAWLGARPRSLATAGAVAFGLSSLWLAVGLSSLVVMDEDVRPGPGIWLAVAAALLVAAAGARATSRHRDAGPSLSMPQRHPGRDEWAVVPGAPAGDGDRGDDW
jgi:hypothetical protein